jgi:hypothetical protein
MDDRSTRIARRLELPLLIAAVLTVPTTIVEESHIGSPWSQLATGLEISQIACSGFRRLWSSSTRSRIERRDRGTPSGMLRG